MIFEQSTSDLASELQTVAPGYVLVFVRVSAMMIFAPLFGSLRIPRTVKMLMALVLSLGIAQGVPMPRIPSETTMWELALGIGGELMFGLAMGMILSFVFIAAQWAGEMIGHQMGLNVSEVLDPQFGGAGSLIGDLYFLLTLVVFLTVKGHHALLIGVRKSFDTLPLMSVGLDRPLLDLLVGLFTSAAMLAFQLAAPMLVTMVIVDLALGCISKTMPQLNVMTAGLSIRSIVGMVVLILGLLATGSVIQSSMLDSIQKVNSHYMKPAAR